MTSSVAASGGCQFRQFRWGRIFEFVYLFETMLVLGSAQSLLPSVISWSLGDNAYG